MPAQYPFALELPVVPLWDLTAVDVSADPCAGKA